MATRRQNGELTSDGKHLSDSSYNKQKTFTTQGGKVVYGGGGIMPDIYVPIDTTGYTPYYYELTAKGILNDFVFKYLSLKQAQYKSVSQLLAEFRLPDSDYMKLKQMAEDHQISENDRQASLSRNLIETDLKALLARYLFGDEGFYRALNASDQVIARSIEVLKKS